MASWVRARARAADVQVRGAERERLVREAGEGVGRRLVRLRTPNRGPLLLQPSPQPFGHRDHDRRLHAFMRLVCGVAFALERVFDFSCCSGVSALSVVSAVWDSVFKPALVHLTFWFGVVKGSGWVRQDLRPSALPTELVGHDDPGIKRVMTTALQKRRLRDDVAWRKEGVPARDR